VIWKRGKLKKLGVSIGEIRKNTILNIDDPSYLAKVVNDERESPHVRQEAAKRLAELNS
jgi:hypothetical protein